MTDLVSVRFRTAIDKLLVLEGGYVNDPKDRGGETKYGISKRSFPSVNIPLLTLDEAAQIYHRHFWTPLKCDRFNSSAVAEELFELGVHASPRRAARILQSACNALGRPLPADGIIGPATIAAVNAIPPKQLLAAFAAQARAYYEGIVEKDPTQKRFLKGWLSRLEVSA